MTGFSFFIYGRVPCVRHFHQRGGVGVGAAMVGGGGGGGAAQVAKVGGGGGGGGWSDTVTAKSNGPLHGSALTWSRPGSRQQT